MLLPSLSIAFIVAYDGTAYLGWQDNGQGRSIESELRRVLEQILQHPVQLQAASRTDVGVHAEGQVVNFTTAKPSLDLGLLHSGINALLPKDIVVRKLWIASTDFHPTLHNTGKEYHFQVCHGKTQLPLQRFFEWHFPYPLDIHLMRQAAQHFLGSHNFQAFCNMRKGLKYDSFIRTVRRLDIIELSEDTIRFELEGNSFLYKMVRNLVGTLVYVGCGKLKVEDIPRILSSHQRIEAGMTAPAHGLILKRVLF